MLRVMMKIPIGRLGPAARTVVNLFDVGKSESLIQDPE
jgi:hypothetical protein